jgi:glycosyltransferase involved in cell wall biosynthesis
MRTHYNYMKSKTASVFDSVTPVLLTYNEESNIARTLQSLQWAKRVVVLDSGSTDGTEEISKTYPNVSWKVHPFLSFGEQWRFGINDTNIKSEYILALDADMEVPISAAVEIERDFLGKGFDGGVFCFELRMAGRPLLGSLYPPDLRIFRRETVDAGQIGHRHHFGVPGSIYRFRNKLVHDDRKDLDRWTLSQLGYAALEEARLRDKSVGGIRAILRRLGVMPLVAGLYGYIRSGGPFKGVASLEYAYQRATFECLPAMRLIKDCQDSPAFAVKGQQPTLVKVASEKEWRTDPGD